MAVKMNTHRQAKRFQNMQIFQGMRRVRIGQIWLNVTALVDMMTVLVIFLLMQFSATGEMLFISKNLRMPSAEHGLDVTRVPILSLDRAGDLYFEGIVIASHIRSPVIDENWEIPSLSEKLKENAIRNSMKIVNVQIDKNVDYGVLKRVLYTCEVAGFGKIRLAVGRESKKHKQI